jgi:hypothetical protein
MASTVRPDIVIESPTGQIVAVAEVRNSIGMDAVNGSEYLRNLMSHQLIPRAEFYMLLTQHEGYLWTDTQRLLDMDAPDVTFDLESIIEEYVPGIDPQAHMIGRVLNYIIARWLTDLALDNRPQHGAAERELDKVGFLGAIRDARIDLEPRY